MGENNKVFVLAHQQARERAADFCWNAPDGYVVKFTEPRRNLDQNAALWPILHEFSEQLQWPVNGKYTYLAPEDWKDLLTAAFRNETTRLAMGLDGSVVMLGTSTSRMTKKTFSEFLDFLKATAAERGVQLHAVEEQVGPDSGREASPGGFE